jgi:hypothetical protein
VPRVSRRSRPGFRHRSLGDGALNHGVAAIVTSTPSVSWSFRAAATFPPSLVLLTQVSKSARPGAPVGDWQSPKKGVGSTQRHSPPAHRPVSHTFENPECVGHPPTRSRRDGRASWVASMTKSLTVKRSAHVPDLHRKTPTARVRRPVANFRLLPVTFGKWNIPATDAKLRFRRALRSALTAALRRSACFLRKTTHRPYRKPHPAFRRTFLRHR